jgi:DNA polymerase-3 subunit chi
MSEVRFYHLERQSQMQVLPLLLSKALERGHRIVVKMSSAGDVERMNDHLWAYDPSGFLPHGSAKNGAKELQPVYLTDEDENPNDADVLILCSGARSDMQGDFKLCCEMLNGNDPEDISAARARWKTYKEKEFDVTYWQQNERGGWDKKA